MPKKNQNEEVATEPMETVTEPVELMAEPTEVTEADVITQILSAPEPDPSDVTAQSALEGFAQNPLLEDGIADIMQIVETQQEQGRPKLAASIERAFDKTSGGILSLIERLATALEKASEERLAIAEKNSALLAHFQTQAAIPPQTHKELYERVKVLEDAYKTLVTNDSFMELVARVDQLEKAQSTDTSALDLRVSALEKVNVPDAAMLEERLTKIEKAESIDLSGYIKTDVATKLEERVTALEKVEAVDLSEYAKTDAVTSLEKAVAALEKDKNIDLSSYAKTDVITKLESKVAALEQQAQKWGEE